MADETEFRALTAEEQAAFQSGFDLVRNIAANVGTPLSHDGDSSDLGLLQTVLAYTKWPQDNLLAIGVGIAFGVVVARAAGLEWVRVIDEWGQETSLKLPGFHYFIHPISMITKRLERGEDIELDYLFKEMVGRCREDGPKMMADRP